MLTRRQAWVGVAIIFLTLAAAFHGMGQPFLGTGLNTAVALIYGFLFVGFIWWVLLHGEVAIDFGRHPGLLKLAVTFGFLILGFGAASISPGVLYTRLLGIPGEWPYVVEKSTYVGYQKTGRKNCYKISFVEVSSPMGDGNLCLTRGLPAGTRLIFSGRRSLMGTYYESFRLSDHPAGTIN